MPRRREGRFGRGRGMIVCPNCGRENADNFNFCLDCGYDLKSYRESQGDGSGPVAAPPVGPANTPAPEPLSHGASTESLNADEVQALAASASSPEQPAVGEQPHTPAPAPAATPAPAPAPTPAPAPAATPAPAPAPVAPAETAPAQPAAAGAQCPSCGTANPPGMRFCGNCGTSLDGSQRPTPAPAPAAATGGEPAGGRTMFMHAADLSAVQREKTCKLVTIDQSGQEGMTYTLKSGETACGRVNGIVLFFDDPFVSPSHCTFAFEGDKLHVRDSGSLNGVYLRLHDEHALGEGDYLRIGRQLFRFEPLDAAKEQVTRPEGDDAKIWGSPNPGAFGRLLQVLEDGRTGEIRLLAGETCNLGREQGEIVFPTDGFISGRHCSFFVRGGDTLVKDLGSSNGTYLRVRDDATVGHGDFLLIGNQMLRVEIV